MVGGARPPKRIDGWGWIAGLAFAIVQAAILVALWSGALSGSTASKFEAHGATLKLHEGRLDGLETRERERFRDELERRDR